jgi:3-deoxy-D-manno-octulosonic-acid transferase
VNRFLRAAYAATGQLARAAASVIPPGDGKIRNSFALRRGVEARFTEWGRVGRHRARPLLWMHAPSVGEGLQARPVLESLHALHPEIQLAYTYYSPSARSFADTLPVGFREILPFDTRAAARAALAALVPDVLVFSKLDVWPSLVEEASALGVKLALISATLPPQSSRLRGFGPALLRDAYARLDAVGAISAEDAERLTRLGCRPSSIEVTGDTRYDQVWARARLAETDGSIVAPFRSTRPTLVAGSTWPADHRHLLPAILRVRAVAPGLRIIIAPHEPDADAIAELESWASSRGLEARRLTHPFARDADVIIVDRVGMLGDLYALADFAFVGGGFHSAGLHSVLEPAAFGAPVAFGPMHANSREAGLLEREGGGASVTDASTLGDVFSRWLTDPVARADAGHRARALVERGTGATRRTVVLIERLLASNVS